MTSLFRKRKAQEEAPGPNLQEPASQAPARPEEAVSVIGRGMTLVGDCRSDDTIRIEGRVEGNVEAGKAIVIGRNGVVVGDIVADAAIIYGRIRGRLTVASRVELYASCAVDGMIDTRHVQLEEGARAAASINLIRRRSASATSGSTP